MSQYEYYEFLSVDEPLTERQRGELRALSTRARITSTSFVNEYHWGSFRGDPQAMMERYFDAHLYLANWGTRELMVKLPRGFLGLTVAQRYCGGENTSAWAAGDNVILSLTSQEEEEYWEEDAEERLGSMVGARAELASGDLRLLYLAWLLSVQSGEIDEDEVEPLVPANLGALSASLRAVADFLRIDDDLLKAAATASAQVVEERIPDAALAAWVERLPAEDKDALLLQAVRGGGAQVQLTLQRTFAAQLRKEPAVPDADRRTAGELLEAARLRCEARERQAREREAREQARREQAAAAAREQRLNALALNIDGAWLRVGGHIDTKKPGEYDLAVTLLGELRTLAERGGDLEKFRRRVGELRELHQRKPSLMQRLDRAGL